MAQNYDNYYSVTRLQKIKVDLPSDITLSNILIINKRVGAISK